MISSQGRQVNSSQASATPAQAAQPSFHNVSQLRRAVASFFGQYGHVLAVFDTVIPQCRDDTIRLHIFN